MPPVFLNPSRPCAFPATEGLQHGLIVPGIRYKSLRVMLQAYNMAALWQLPILFVVENNHFGMGTSERRAAKATEFYKRGDYVPGLWVDGMDVLAVKQGVVFAKEYALENGPVVLEMVSQSCTDSSTPGDFVAHHTK